MHPERLTKTFGRLVRKHGPTVKHLHTLRHYFAASLISDGCDIATVCYLMGHSSIKVTYDIYGHLFDEAKARKAAVASIDAQVWGAPTA